MNHFLKRCIPARKFNMDMEHSLDLNSESGYESDDNDACSSSSKSSNNRNSFSSSFGSSPSFSDHFKVMDRHSGGINSLAVTNDYIYTGLEDGQVCCWLRRDNARSLVDAFGRKGKGSIRNIQLLSGNIVMVAQGQNVKIWRRRSSGAHEHVTTLPTFIDRVSRSIFASNHVRVRRHQTCPWNQHFDRVTSIAMGSERDVVYTGSWDRTIKVWSFARKMACVESIDAHDDAINALLAGGRRPDGGTTVLSCSSDGTVRVWERPRLAEGGHFLAATMVHRSGVNAIAAGDLLYAGCIDGTIAVWEMHMIHREKKRLDTPREVLRGHGRAILCISAAATDALCSGSADGSVRVWKRSSSGLHICLAALHFSPSPNPGRKSRGAPVRCIAATETSGYIMVYAGCSDGSLNNWQVPLLEN